MFDQKHKANTGDMIRPIASTHSIFDLPMGVAAIILGWDKSPPLFQMISLDPPLLLCGKSVHRSIHSQHSVERCVSASLSNPFHLLIERMPKSMKLRAMFSLLLCTKAYSHIARTCSDVLIHLETQSVCFTGASVR